MFQMKMALICSSTHLISVITFLLWCLKCSIRMLYAGTVLCNNPYSMDECSISKVFLSMMAPMKSTQMTT